MLPPIKLADYTTVRERIAAFYRRFPEGSIRTELARLADDLVVFQAFVYRDGADPHPTTGWAYDRVDEASDDEARIVEHCEAAAIGRALANRGFAGKKRPSREEMAKVLRLGGRG